MNGQMDQYLLRPLFDQSFRQAQEAAEGVGHPALSSLKNLISVSVLDLKHFEVYVGSAVVPDMV